MWFSGVNNGNLMNDQEEIYTKITSFYSINRIINNTKTALPRILKKKKIRSSAEWLRFSNIKLEMNVYASSILRMLSVSFYEEELQHSKD